MREVRYWNAGHCDVIARERYGSLVRVDYRRCEDGQLLKEAVIDRATFLRLNPPRQELMR